VSPQEADCRADVTPLGSVTLISLPGDGVELRAVLIHRFGKAAGPSLLLPKSGVSPDRQYRLSGCARAVVPIMSSVNKNNFFISITLAGKYDRGFMAGSCFQTKILASRFLRLTKNSLRG
jgi:hypothetical protein